MRGLMEAGNSGRALMMTAVLAGGMAGLGRAQTTTATTAMPAATGAKTTATPAATNDEIGRKIEAYVDAYVAKKGFCGAVLVAKDGKPLFRKAYGYSARHEKRFANTPETTFALMSISKTFTAAAIMLLQERGLLDVQKSVTAYLPDCPTVWQPVTLHHLLTHTSGIASRDANDWDGIGVVNPGDLKRTRQQYQAKPLLFAPGTQWHYSNGGYVLLARIVERVSGQTFRDFMRANIFEPLGMTHTDCNNEILGAGNVESNVDDLLRWDQALLGDTLLSNKTRQAMFTPVQTSPNGQNGYSASYGYGWQLDFLNGKTHIFHTGRGGGDVCVLDRYPKEGLCVILLSSLHTYPELWTPGDLLAMARGEERIAFEQAPLPLLKSYVGRYQLPRRLVLTLSLKRGRLWFDLPRVCRMEARPLSETRFQISDMQIEMQKDVNGSIIGLRFFSPFDNGIQAPRLP